MKSCLCEDGITLRSLTLWKQGLNVESTRLSVAFTRSEQALPINTQAVITPWGDNGQQWLKEIITFLIQMFTYIYVNISQGDSLGTEKETNKISPLQRPESELESESLYSHSQSPLAASGTQAWDNVPVRLERRIITWRWRMKQMSRWAMGGSEREDGCRFSHHTQKAELSIHPTGSTDEHGQSKCSQANTDGSTRCESDKLQEFRCTVINSLYIDILSW